MSFDQGATWDEAFQLQPGWAAYSSMQVLDNGDLAILFEDGSIGNEDINDCFDINYVITSSETINAKIDELYGDKYNVKIAYENNAPSSYGDWTKASDATWYQRGTSNATSGIAGLTLQSTYANAFNQAQNIYSKYVLALKVSETGATDKITITAPEGYIIKSYQLNARSYNSGKDYTLTSGPTSLSTVYTGWRTFNVGDIYTTSASFDVTTAQDQTNYLCISDFVVTLTQSYPLSLSPINGKSYATLYLPYGITLPGDVTAYKIRVSGEWAVPTSMGQELPAETAALLVSESGVTSALATLNSSASADTDGNALLGVLTATSGEDLKGYVLNIVDGELGFFKLDNGGTLAANRAYLPASLIDGTGVKGVVLNWDEETRIGELKNESMEEGKSSTLFDLSGRRISVRPVLPKGIYIVNGKKVVIK